MKNKRLAKWIALALALAQVLLPLQSVIAVDEQLAEGTVTLSIAEFKLYTAEGTLLEPGEDNVYTNVPRDAQFYLKFDFDTEDELEDLEGNYSLHQVESGLADFAASFNIDPSPFELFVNGVKLAEVTISSEGVVRIDFEDDLDEYKSEVKGQFEIAGAFSPTELTGETGTSFEVDTETTIEINFLPEPTPDPTPAATIEKRGEYNEATKTITWFIDVTPAQPVDPDNLTTYVVTDQLDLTWQDFSGSSPVADSDPTGQASGLYTFTLEDLAASATIEIYTTLKDGAYPVTEGGTRDIFNSSANLYELGDLEIPVGTVENEKVTITTDWVQKSGNYREDPEDSGTYYIDWEITLNNNHRTIPEGSKLVDVLGAGAEYLTLVGTGTYAPQIKIGSGAFGNMAVVTNDPDHTDSLFTYTFDDDINEVVTIKFTTLVGDAYFNQQAEVGFTNTATLLVEGDENEDGYSGTAAKEGIGEDPGTGVPTSLVSKTHPVSYKRGHADTAVEN